MHDDYVKVSGSDSPDGFKSHLLQVQRQLGFKVGYSYVAAVKLCLEVSEVNSEEADEAAHQTLLEVIRKLEVCSA